MHLAASPALALPLISELFYDAVGSDNGQSFVELYGAPGASLEGLVLEGVQFDADSLGLHAGLSERNRLSGGESVGWESKVTAMLPMIATTATIRFPTASPSADRPFASTEK